MTGDIYLPSDIEKKWQDLWEESGAFLASDDFTKPKFYALIEFPYPSGAGLHVGHPRSNTAMDIIARKRRMDGYNVLYPIGWDAFGLPTENYAIANNIHPAVVTSHNINRFRNQLKSIGFSFDYTREVNTADPKYFKWTQWIFLKLFEHGLAYKGEMPINYCTSCKVGLSNEEVVDGVCERCGGQVIQKVKSQWMLRITDYAQKLLDGLGTVDFIEKVKIQQRNWIGKSVGAEIYFAIAGTKDDIHVFTTRPDTLFGATYMVLSPFHPLIDRYAQQIKNFPDIRTYRERAGAAAAAKPDEPPAEKTGLPLIGFCAVNPATGASIPIWVSDYVLMSYGTGAIMGVPGHDERDWAFAKKFGLPIVEVVSGGDVEKEALTDTDLGTMVNSRFLNGLAVKDAQNVIIDWLIEQGLGERAINYKLRDWVFSRQRYWGEPIPLVMCERCGWVPLPYDRLPLTLPEVTEFRPGEDGESPLASVDHWVQTTCPKCGGPARRETDTMPQWAGSSWYFLRYIDPHNDNEIAALENLRYWLPVDWYNGGMEHTTLHLLYSRFWHRFLYDIGVVTTPEPYQKRTSHGMILGENGEKMSKSRGNVVNPDEMVREFGADAFRLYEMFMGKFDQAIPWSTQGVKGCRRFLERLWRLQFMVRGNKNPSLNVPLHKLIKKVSEDCEAMKFNTAIAAMMTFVNTVFDAGSIGKNDFCILLQLISPAAPHIAEELWQRMGNTGLICKSKWPKYDPALCTDEMKEIAVQVNGKVRGRIQIEADASDEVIEQLALANRQVKSWLLDKTVVKIIVVQGKIINIVVA